MMLRNVSKWSESKRGLFFVLCLSAVIKVSIALSNKVINPDGILYISAAQQFALGNFREGLALYPMPFYPLVIAFVHYFVPHWVAAARLISITSLVLALIPLYLLANDLFDRKVAFWGCLTFALAPLANYWAMEVIRGPSFVFLFAWAVYFAQRAIRSTRLVFFFMAVFFSWFSFLFRIEGVILIPVYLLFFICLGVWKPQERGPLLKGILVWIAFPLLLFLIFFVALGPEGVSLNRLDQVMGELRDLLHLGFLDNYYRIYEKLKTLESSSPFSGLHQNFAAIARHYIPIIYLFGLLQTLIKVLFPFFVIPLFWGFRHSLRQTRVFVLGLVIFYLLMVYYTLIVRDNVSTRFLFAPAFLLYPWIGVGMERMFAFLKRSSRPTFLATVFVIVFLVSPVCKCVSVLAKQDKVISMAGEWLAKTSEFHKAKMIATDARFLFYAGREIYGGGEGSSEYVSSQRGDIWHMNESHDYVGMEQFALAKQMDLIIVRVSVKRKNLIPELEYYKKVKEFTGKKNIAIIYCSPEFHKTLNLEDNA
ncbi:MAG: glycosyltransferase family 39 protein [Deltaproteobacteria bacterium]|nr:glycosyltransferase family 39 protein [Deltaproteobacteria bacterium]